MNIQSLKKIGLLSGLFFTFIAIVLNFISFNFYNLDGGLIGVVALLRFGSYIATAFCYFLSFITEREKLDFLIAGSLGLYSLANLLINCFFYNPFGYGVPSTSIYLICSCVGFIALFLTVIVFLIKARRTNMFVILIGLAALGGLCLDLLYDILQGIFYLNIGYAIYSIFSSLLGIGIALFWFLEAKAEDA